MNSKTLAMAVFASVAMGASADTWWVSKDGGVDWTAPDRVALKAALDAKGVKVLPFAGLSAHDVHDAAVAAGAYVPAPFGLQVDMDGSFASVHCLNSGRYAFRTPSGRTIHLDLTVGDSRWLDLR